MRSAIPLPDCSPNSLRADSPVKPSVTASRRGRAPEPSGGLAQCVQGISGLAGHNVVGGGLLLR